jgi:hypothetical protein
MDESWPASPRADELSDSISSHAAEVERTLRALEAVEAFRAEAAALRAELHAARTPQYTRPAFRRVPGPELPASTWRLIIEAGLLVGIALACWAMDLRRVEIILVMAGAWFLVAMLEALAWRRSEAVYRPAPVMAAPPQVPVAPVTQPAPQPEPQPQPQPQAVWPERSEAAQPTTVLPVSEPEAKRAPEPGAPLEPGANAEPEPEPEAVEDADVENDLTPRVRRFPRLRRRREPAETAQP